MCVCSIGFCVDMGQSTSHRQPENKSRNLLMATLTMNNNRICRKYIASNGSAHIHTHTQADRIECCGQHQQVILVRLPGRLPLAQINKILFTRRWSKFGMNGPTPMIITCKHWIQIDVTTHKRHNIFGRHLCVCVCESFAHDELNIMPKSLHTHSCTQSEQKPPNSVAKQTFKRRFTMLISFCHTHTFVHNRKPLQITPMQTGTKKWIETI